MHEPVKSWWASEGPSATCLQCNQSGLRLSHTLARITEALELRHCARGTTSLLNAPQQAQQQNGPGSDQQPRALTFTHLKTHANVRSTEARVFGMCSNVRIWTDWTTPFPT
jgi:hypothetical protein